MANKLAGGIKADSSQNQLEITLTKSADGLPQTGKLAADLTVSYRRQGAAAVQVTNPTFAALHDLATITDAWSESGVKESDAALQPGMYRIDYPNSAFLSGADYVTVCVQCVGCFPYEEKIPLETQGAAEVFALVSGRNNPLDANGTRAALGEATANLDAQLTAIAGYIDTEVSAIKAKTDLIAGAPTVIGDIPTANQISAAMLASVVEAGLTFQHLCQEMATMLGGMSNGAPTGTENWRDHADTKDRLIFTVDADGNRTAVTRNFD